MNPSQPVSSQISNVRFGYLTADHVRQLSAKRITSAVTFDTLANPIPGGLYSAELGQFMDNACATCGLKNPQCPGHPGHIELPVPCYHPTFFDQILRLLRGACIYCGKLKMKRILVTRFICKLRLVRHGLLKELKELEEKEIQAASDPTKAGAHVDQDEDESDAGDADTRALSLMLEQYVNDAIKRARRNGTLSTAKSEATNAERRRIIQDFMSNINKGKRCGNCGGINHSYRKDRFVKLFKKPLSEKDHAAMVQKGLKARDPLVEMRRKLRAERSRKRKRDEDEAPTIIGGDLEDAMVIDGAAETAARAQKKPKAQDEYLNPSRVYAQLQQLFESDAEVLSLVYGQASRKGLSADMFFLQTLLVPPNRFRPEARQGDGAISEALENGAYRSILQNCDTITEIQRELSGGKPAETRYRERTYADLESAWLVLQENVNTLIDKDRSPLQGAANARTPDGIKQKLEKKEGMFRKYMMGKRVNFAARTVISPDPNIETNEIGVPPVFAVKLTYPEPVTQWNYEELQAAVQNGPHIWPGAVAIESENGSVISLERKNPEERLALANSLLAPSPSGNTRGARPKKVHRHLNNGDIVIMNRQPTLHKPSMMCHRARVLPGEKTLRMHYANCNTYNADFDGDEMNMHFPQNELARAEALSIADTDHQYLSGTAGNPLRGLIQDHISMCVWLTSRDMFFERGDYMNLLYAALRPESGHCSNGKVETVPPAVFKPKPMWTGKQVVSTILKNLQPQGAQGLTMNGKSTTPATMWGKVGKDEGEVIVKDGDLLQGILDKKQIGPASGGFVNAVYEAYGHTIAGKLLSVLGRLLTKLLHMRAFSCGVEDLIFTRNGEESRQKALAGAQTVGLEVASKYVSLQDQKPTSEDKELKRRLEDVVREDAKLHGLDLLSNAATAQLSSQVSTDCMPAGLAKPFPKNQMQTMTNSGAKGSKVNVNLISCNLGQQVLEGRRVPVMVSGKTLPCFAPFDSSVRAGGYIVDRFLTGIRPQEYFFHAMAGREGLIDTAVKTSRSGYLQRCLIKGMEGLRVEYDTTVRNTEDGSVVQFLYGEDGLDVGKAKYMDDYKFTAENYLSLFNSMQMGEAFDRLLSQEAKDHNKAAEKKFRKTGDLGSSDPAIALYSPANHVGAISEKQFTQIRDYIESNPHRLVRDKKQGVDGPSTLSKRNLEHILAVRYLKSVVESGEAVGVVAGQSVGEPSTQMTLNTFHLAGHAAKNVTLGIPRLREIVMTAAKEISTPQMTLLMNRGISAEDAKKFAKGISKLSLAEIIDKVTVSETVGKGIGYGEAKQYSIRLDFFPSDEYRREYAITVQDVVRTIEHSLLPVLQKTVRKELKKRGDAKTLKGVEAALGEVESGSPEPEESFRTDRKNIAANRLDRIKGSDKTNDIASFEFDDRKGSYCNFVMEYDSTTAKILMLNLLETSLRNSLIQHVDKIEGCMLDEEALKDAAKKSPDVTPTPTLLASGVNIKAMWDFQHAINPNHIYTNSIHDILLYYGVEAARAAIVKELQSVFGGHGISVDPRHLMLIADYMTRNGGYQAFSRMGYGSNVSPFMKMSFETTVSFLKDAVLNGEVEDLKGPSARIVVGKVGGMGTGMCDVFLPVRERGVEEEEEEGDVEMED
ncbi:uncharacterized protein MYCFIDRAFT_64562 [Pseudocercospora fijiensis CIRAD86]|uniref:DNA-directed RNA polymerase subunit n=1 Tax=Pseudocercospora fijiensis (strain CIRAD86) TaxID=383855 RepID=M3AV57_PSEFD|nr:uncharacterized protein MYCFIDRAFT_64562 [Pseudocercospora fijiensis CIRAD86]EME81367.1 hypothetical protein MYCFIDRAFT_64562 [Pseudocercospora fijiensis CIRAD86]